MMCNVIVHNYLCTYEQNTHLLVHLRERERERETACSPGDICTTAALQVKGTNSTCFERLLDGVWVHRGVL